MFVTIQVASTNFGDTLSRDTVPTEKEELVFERSIEHKVCLKDRIQGVRKKVDETVLVFLVYNSVPTLDDNEERVFVYHVSIIPDWGTKVNLLTRMLGHITSNLTES